MVLDLKTGEKAVAYPHAIAIQLAIYANAPLMAGPLPPSGGETFDFAPMPAEVNKETGLVIHMPTESQVEVKRVDIAKGWEKGFKRTCQAIIDWRETGGLIDRHDFRCHLGPQAQVGAGRRDRRDTGSAPCVSGPVNHRRTSGPL